MTSSSQEKSPIKKRIEAIDGLRGIAIILVILFHSYHFNNGYPWGLFYENYFFIKYGYMGVMLFFTISGFVISQTLHVSSRLSDFWIRRFARLWPTMLLCSTITLGLSLFFPSDPRYLLDYIPSLTFIAPNFFELFFKGVHFQYMDSSYWSLFTEVRFYLIVSFIYFYKPELFYRNYLIISTVIGFTLVITIATNYYSAQYLLTTIFIANQLPWFSFGIGMFYIFSQEFTKGKMLILFGSGMLLAYAIVGYLTPKPLFYGTASFDAFALIIGAVLIISIMFFAIGNGIINKFLSARILSAIGITSYSLYLLHQYIGDKFIKTIGNPLGYTKSTSAIYGLVPFVILVSTSLFIYRYYETPLNKFIVRKFKKD